MRGTAGESLWSIMMDKIKVKAGDWVVVCDGRKILGTGRDLNCPGERKGDFHLRRRRKLHLCSVSSEFASWAHTGSSGKRLSLPAVAEGLSKR